MSQLTDQMYRGVRQRGGSQEDAIRHVYATGYVEGMGYARLDLDLPVIEYNTARRAGYSHAEALDEVLLAGYQSSPRGQASAAQRFADEIAGL